MTGKELGVYARAKGNRVGTINEERNNDQPKELALRGLHLEYVHNFCVCIKMKWDEQIILLGLGLVAAILAKKAGVDGSYDKNAEGIKRDIRALQEEASILPTNSPAAQAIGEVFAKMGEILSSSGNKEKSGELADRAISVITSIQAQVGSASDDQSIVENPSTLKKVTEDQLSKITYPPQDVNVIRRIIFDGEKEPPVIFPVETVRWDPANPDVDVERAESYRQSQFAKMLVYGRVWIFNEGPGKTAVPDNLHVVFFRPMINNDGDFSHMGYIGTSKCEKVTATLIAGDMFQYAVVALYSNQNQQQIYKAMLTGDVECVFTLDAPDLDQIPTLSRIAEHWGANVPRKPGGDRVFYIFRHAPTFIPPGDTLFPNGTYAVTKG